jgi:hypothetical protein
VKTRGLTICGDDAASDIDVYRKQRRRRVFKSRHDGLQCVAMTRRATSGRPYVQNKGITGSDGPYNRQGLTLAHFRAQLEDLRDTSLT